MKVKKVILISVGSLLVLAIIAFIIFKLAFSQSIAESFEINDPECENSLLIATQGSDFKEVLVSSLIEHFSEESVYISVIDVSSLSEIDENDWNAIVLINTVEIEKMHPDVIGFLSELKSYDKIILLITSGSGDWDTEDYNIDTITSASETSEIDSLAEVILSRLAHIFHQ